MRIYLSLITFLEQINSMHHFRVTYVKDGEEVVAPFYFDNIHEARRARELYRNRGYLDISILVKRNEDNINP